MKTVSHFSSLIAMWLLLHFFALISSTIPYKFHLFSDDNELSTAFSSSTSLISNSDTQRKTGRLIVFEKHAYLDQWTKMSSYLEYVQKDIYVMQVNGLTDASQETWALNSHYGTHKLYMNL